jgi:hypothetical protein
MASVARQPIETQPVVGSLGGNPQWIGVLVKPPELPEI